MKKLIFMGCALLSVGLVLGTQAKGAKATRLGVKNLDMKVSADIAALIEFEAEGFDDSGRAEINLIGPDGKKASDAERIKVIKPRIKTESGFAKVVIDSTFTATNEYNDKIQYFVKMTNEFDGEKEELQESKTFERISVGNNKPIKLEFDFDEKILQQDIRCGKYTSTFKISLQPVE